MHILLGTDIRECFSRLKYVHQLRILLANSKARLALNESSQYSERENRVRQQYLKGALPMSNLDQKNAEFADDDIIQITNLAPAGASPYKHAQRALALVLKGITTPWIRYSLAGLLILALLSALLPQLHALTSSASSPNTSVTEPHSLALVSANGQVFVQSVNNLLIAFQASTGRRLWQQQLSNVATLSATGQALYFYYVNNNGSSATFEALDTSTGKPIWQKSS